jgi:NAD(P)-dependent dehydrogenase (short-subunit alcohol dehydrogenase family)
VAKNVVIVGANRGIGLELVRCYKNRGEHVIAICRKSSEELRATGAEVIEGVDVTNDQSFAQLAQKLPVDKIDLFIHSAGILRGDQFPEIDLDSMREQFEVNTLGPLKSVLALKDKLVQGSKVGLVTSRVGSIEDNSSSNNYGYRTSKTALNMIGKCLALDLKDQGIAVALLHPGYVRTEMTGGNGLIEADESAAGLVERMEELNLENTGLFVHTSGERLTW